MKYGYKFNIIKGYIFERGNVLNKQNKNQG